MSDNITFNVKWVQLTLSLTCIMGSALIALEFRNSSEISEMHADIRWLKELRVKEAMEKPTHGEFNKAMISFVNQQEDVNRRMLNCAVANSVTLDNWSPSIHTVALYIKEHESNDRTQR